MEVVGRLPYIAGDVEKLWNSQSYSETEVNEMIEDGAVYEARIYFGRKLRRVALIGSLVDLRDNNRKILYLKKDKKDWVCCFTPFNLIAKIEILDDLK